MGQVGNLVVVGLLTIASGLLDARGFVYAARAWPEGQLDLKIGAGLAGLRSPAASRPTSWRSSSCRTPAFTGVALQSGIWFVVTAVGIAAMDGTSVAMDPHPAGGRRRGGDRAGLADLHHAQRRGLTTNTEQPWIPDSSKCWPARSRRRRCIFSEARQLIVCPTSKLAYPIKDGIPAMLPEDAIKLEDGDPLLNAPAALTRRGLRSSSVLACLVELEQLAFHAIEVVEARQLAQVAGFAP